MRAVVCHRLSEDRSGLAYETAWPEPPVPNSGQVTVAVSHAALNFPDLLMLSGGYQTKPRVPFVPGTEAAGIVIASGSGAEALLGERVIVGGLGCLSERVTLPMTSVRAIPDGFDSAEASAFTIGALTAWVGLMARGRLARGERVLVTGAGGGMGLAAVALAVHEGAHVVAAASTEERLSAARGAGAQETLLIDRAAPAFGAREIDIVFDPVGGTLAHPAIRALRRGGRYLIIGFAGGMPPPFPVNRALLKEIEILGVRAGEAGRQDPAAGRGFLTAIDSRAAALRPVIGLTLPLDRGREGFTAMADGHLTGKAVIMIGKS